MTRETRRRRDRRRSGAWARAALVAVAAIVGAATSAGAQVERVLTDQEYDGFVAVTNETKAALSALDTVAVFELAPPSVIEAIARARGETVDAFVAEIARENRGLAGAAVSFRSFDTPARPVTATVTGDTICVLFDVAYDVSSGSGVEALERTLFVIREDGEWRSILLSRGKHIARVIRDGYGSDVCGVF